MLQASAFSHWILLQHFWLNHKNTWVKSLMLSEFFKMIKEINQVLLMINCYKEKKIANNVFDVQFSWSFVTTGLYTGLCSPSSSYQMCIHDITYSEPQQHTPLKSLCFRWSKFRINFSPAHVTPLVQQRLFLTWSCKVGFYMLWQRAPVALVCNKMVKSPLFANG